MGVSLRRRGWVAMAALPVLLLAGLLGSGPGKDERPSRLVQITLLHTNDLHGRVLMREEGSTREVTPGLARIAALARRLRREQPNSLLLDGGDIRHGTPEEKAFAGQSMLAAMNAAGYDAAAAGNHEFDFGQAVLRAGIREARFPFLSANVRDAETGEPWGGLRPYVVRTLQGVRVGIFGLTTPETVRIEWPRTLAGIRFVDPIEAAREVVPRLRVQERADVVVAVTHLGVEPDRALAAAVPGIDFIVGGHTHTALTEQVWVGNTLIAQAGGHARYLGRIDFVVRKSDEGSAEITAVNGRGGKWWGDRDPTPPAPSPRGRGGAPGARLGNSPLPLGEGVGVGSRSPLIALTAEDPEDPAVLAAYRPYAERLRPQLEEVLTRAEEALPQVGARRGETALGDLLADAVRAQAGTEVGLFSADHVAAGLAAREVRVRDLYRVMDAYTRQHVVVARGPGAALRQLFARAVTPRGVRVQVAGVRVSPEGITVGGEPLDPGRTYTVAGPAHIIQEFLLPQAGVEIVEDDVRAPTVRDAAIAFLRGHAPLRNVKEGRIVVSVERGG